MDKISCVFVFILSNQPNQQNMATHFYLCFVYVTKGVNIAYLYIKSMSHLLDSKRHTSLLKTNQNRFDFISLCTLYINFKAVKIINMMSKWDKHLLVVRKDKQVHT